MTDEAREMGEAVDRARAIITAMGQGLTELTEEGMAMANVLIGEVEAEITAMEDREVAGARVGQLVTALANLAVHIAQMPPEILNRLENQGVEIPPGAAERFGDAQRTISTAFMLAEMDPGDWSGW